MIKESQTTITSEFDILHSDETLLATKIKYPRKLQIGPRKKMLLIKKTDKHTRHTIYHSFKFNPATQRRMPSGDLFYVYEHKDKLVFRTLKYKRDANLGNKLIYSTNSHIGVLKRKNNKFNFYVKAGKKWVNGSNKYSFISLVFPPNINNKKIYLVRLKRVINGFLIKNGLKRRTITDVKSTIIRLCYPALDKLAVNGEVIKHIPKEYCRYYRGKDTSRFIRSFKVNNHSYPRFYKQTYMEMADGMIPKSFKYIKLDKTGRAKCIVSDNSNYIMTSEWTEKQCNDNVLKGKFKEIPFAEAALM